MHKLLFTLAVFVFLSTNAMQAQSSDSLQVERACLDYIEGFYEGDTMKLKACLSPTLYKYGYWKNKEGAYSGEQMTYAEAIAYGKGVLEKKQFAKPTAPKKVQVLDVQAQVACAQIFAWWGMDYALLSKKEGVWKIEQVLWQGPYKTVKL